MICVEQNGKGISCSIGGILAYQQSVGVSVVFACCE